MLSVRFHKPARSQKCRVLVQAEKTIAEQFSDEVQTNRTFFLFHPSINLVDAPPIKHADVVQWKASAWPLERLSINSLSMCSYNGTLASSSTSNGSIADRAKHSSDVPEYHGGLFSYTKYLTQ